MNVSNTLLTSTDSDQTPYLKGFTIANCHRFVDSLQSKSLFLMILICGRRFLRAFPTDAYPVVNELRCEKTGLRGSRPGPTQFRAVQLQKMARGLKFLI